MAGQGQSPCPGGDGGYTFVELHQLLRHKQVSKDPELPKEEFPGMDRPHSRVLTSGMSLIPQRPCGQRRGPGQTSAIAGARESRGLGPEAVCIKFKFYFINFFF